MIEVNASNRRATNRKKTQQKGGLKIAEVVSDVLRVF